MKKENLTLTLLLVNILLTIRSIGASYRASEWAAQGFIDKIGTTADYLFLSSMFIILAIVFSIVPFFSKHKNTEKLSVYGMGVCLVIAVFTMVYTVFI